MSTASRGLVIPVTGVLLTTMLSTAAMSVGHAANPSTAAFAQEAPIYEVTQEGMTSDQAKQLAERAGIADALRKDGSFSFVNPRRFAVLPTLVGDKGRDENGNPTVAKRLDLTALRQLEVIPDDTALGQARELLPIADGFDVSPRVSHTTVELAGRSGKPLSSRPIDTTVSYDLRLGNTPVVGPGARSRIAFAGDGSVIQLTQVMRSVTPAGSVPIMSPDEALNRCVKLYGAKVAQTTPTLAYYAPLLTGDGAGHGTVKALLPHYACAPANTPQDETSILSGRLVPAALDFAPAVKMGVSSDGKSVKGSLSVDGGQAPYSIRWSSSSTNLLRGGETVSYLLTPRAVRRTEYVTATVTDANGIVSTARAALPAAGGDAVATGVGGAGGAFGSVGIEQTVDEWQCAQDSAIGFKSVMQAKGQAVKFDWRGANAWERDFHKTSTGGDDFHYADDVDAQWYTGHGNSGGFTFKSSVDDTSIVPGDARWGDNWNLEWMQLESCQVLRDTNGLNDYFGRWAPAFDGLHILNGFDTNATCIGGGTGRRFAEYLFPAWWRSPLSVSQAWASMANDLEPSGTRWRSISPAAAGWVHNLNDRYWGQGTTGPDIPASQRIGFVAISGVV